jgi:hypothetical protein
MEQQLKLIFQRLAAVSLQRHNKVVEEEAIA